MITKELLEEIREFQTNYIKNICYWDLFDSFWQATYNTYSGDDAELDFSSDLPQIWKLLQPGFKLAFDSFKSELFSKHPILESNGWDGILGFYAEVWNTHANKLFERANNYDFINLGESTDGGSYFFSLQGYSESNSVQFSRDAQGDIVMSYSPVPYSLDSDGGSY